VFCADVPLAFSASSAEIIFFCNTGREIRITSGIFPFMDTNKAKEFG
jgi:hypothetical protein